MADQDVATAPPAGEKGKRKTPAKVRADEQTTLEELANAADDEGGGEAPSDGAEASSGDQSLDLSEEAHSTAIELMEEAASDYEIDQRNLVPDARDFLLDQIKHRPKPWSATSNAEQRDVAAACEHAAVELVRKVVEAVRADPSSNPIRCLLIGYADKGDDIKVDLKVKALSTEETTAAVLGLHRAKGKHVLLTIASVDDFRGDDRDPALDVDEPPLDFEAGGGDSTFDQHPDDDSDLGGDATITAPGDLMRTGCQTLVKDKGLREVRVNLTKGWVQWADVSEDSPTIGELDWADLREATPVELAAERERVADFAAD